MYITEMLYSEANNTNTGVMLFFVSEPNNEDNVYSINQLHILHIFFRFPAPNFPTHHWLKKYKVE